MSILQRVRRRIWGAWKFIRNYGQLLPHAFRAIFKMTCDIVVICGETRPNRSEATILYVGRGMNFEFLVQQLFWQHEVVSNTRTTLFRYRRHMDRSADNADAVFVDIGWPYLGRLRRSGQFVEVPDWVGMALELEPTWEQVIQKFRHTARNNDLRLIRRNRYRCSPTRDRAAIEEFYDTMYLPYVHGRHDADAVIAPRRHVLRRAASGWLLRVQSDNDIVVAGVVYPENGVLYFLWMGMPRQYLDNVPEAAISALYYFGIRHAYDNGLSAVDFTGTRAFLGDGAFRFKRKWGAVIEDAFSPSAILLRPTGASERTVSFFAVLPVLARDGGELDARFVAMGGTVDHDTFVQLEKRYACPGIATITVVEIGNDDRVDELPNEQGECRYRHVRCRRENFASRYVRARGDEAGEL